MKLYLVIILVFRTYIPLFYFIFLDVICQMIILFNNIIRTSLQNIMKCITYPSSDLD